MLEKSFDNLLQIRLNFIKIVEAYEIEKLNEIPKGFNNNIIWNFGHIIATQQILCYKFSGKNPIMDLALIDVFKKGSLPKELYDITVIDRLKKLAISMVHTTSKDFFKGIFNQYEPYETSFGIRLSSINEAVVFNNIHEGLHLGYVMAQIKSLSNHTS